MFAYHLNKIVVILALLALSACAYKPHSINNVCAVFAQKDGWINNWQSSAAKASGKYGIPVPVLMATMRKESGFKSNARPPRGKLLGFIPWKRASSAYGYSQALNGTWEQYQRETNSPLARRNVFADAIDFVGWYHSKTVRNHGVAPNDAYHLYLAYYSGWGGFSKGSWRSNSSLKRYARETQEMASSYAAQLRSC